MLWGWTSLLIGKPGLTLARKYWIELFLTWSQRTGNMGERETESWGPTVASGHLQQWNPGDLSINRQVVVAGSMQARSIASLLIAMCTDNAAHGLYVHMCQNLYGTSHAWHYFLFLGSEFWLGIACCTFFVRFYFDKYMLARGVTVHENHSRVCTSVLKSQFSSFSVQ